MPAFAVHMTWLKLVKMNKYAYPVTAATVRLTGLYPQPLTLFVRVRILLPLPTIIK